MMSLLLERDQQLKAALESLLRLSSILEQKYEESEDLDILQKFCIVKSDMGRVSLALGQFEEAVESSSTALDLSQTLEDLEKTSLSSQIVVGLGHYFLRQMDDAIDAFQTVLSESNEDVDVMLLVARALWAVGGDREKEVAIQQIQDWYVYVLPPLTIVW
jgi:superkiller protein 3